MDLSGIWNSLLVQPTGEQHPADRVDYGDRYYIIRPAKRPGTRTTTSTSMAQWASIRRAPNYFSKTTASSRWI